MATIFTTGELGDLLCVEEWKVRRLYESRDLPEPDRFGGMRAIPREDIPEIVDALRSRGWLPPREVLTP